MNDFEILEPIGEGSFAKVLKVKRKTSNKIYAMKKVNVKKMSHKEISQSLNEIRFLSSVHHPHIVGFYECFQVGNEEICLVLEYCPNGDLQQEIDRHKKQKSSFEEPRVWRYLSHILQALEVLHKHKIVHRDLKAANCFIGDEDSIKLGDMNISKRIKNDILLQTQAGTPYYMSPEVWENKPYDETSDMWALGILLYELCTLKKPFTGINMMELRFKVTTNVVPQPKSSSDINSIISLLLKKDPLERATARKVLDDPVLKRNVCKDTNDFEELDIGDIPELLETIIIPDDLENISTLEEKFPKPWYPDENRPALSGRSRSFSKKYSSQDSLEEVAPRGGLTKLKSFNLSKDCQVSDLIFDEKCPTQPVRHNTDFRVHPWSARLENMVKADLKKPAISDKRTKPSLCRSSALDQSHDTDFSLEGDLRYLFREAREPLKPEVNLLPPKVIPPQMTSNPMDGDLRCLFREYRESSGSSLGSCPPLVRSPFSCNSGGSQVEAFPRGVGSMNTRYRASSHSYEHHEVPAQVRPSRGYSEGPDSLEMPIQARGSIAQVRPCRGYSECLDSSEMPIQARGSIARSMQKAKQTMETTSFLPHTPPMNGHRHVSMNPNFFDHSNSPKEEKHQRRPVSGREHQVLPLDRQGIPADHADVSVKRDGFQLHEEPTRPNVVPSKISPRLFGAQKHAK